MPESTVRSRLVRAALALAVVVGLSACAGIPTSGSVTAGSVINDEVEPVLGFAPQGPRAGSTQEEILADFIAAATNPQSNYEIAREFLSEDFTQEWKPDALTTIRSGVGTVRRVTDVELGYSLSTSASVDPEGRYQETDPASSTLSFTFVKEGDEWRIGSAPDGIVLSANNFPQVFGEYPLYYFDPTGRFLVPDVRWFPTRSSTSLRVVTSLLAGQSSWLSNGVLVSAFPAGTQLGSELVTIEAGIATVDLSEEARATTAAERDRMRQQVSASLPTATSVVLTVGGIPLDIPDTGSTPAVINPVVEAAPLIQRDTSFGYASGDDITTIDGVSDKVVGLAPSAVALARSKSEAVVLSDAGVSLVQSGVAAPLVVDSRADLVAPSIDNSGYVWSVPRSDASAIRVYEFDGTPHDVASSLSAGGTVISLEVSRDGARVLAYLSTDIGPQLFVAGVVRQDGVPIALGEAFQLQASSAAPLDATWVDNRTVATLSESGDETVVTAFEIGGPSETLGQIENGVTIVGGNAGTDGVRVLTTDGELFFPRGSSWQKSGITATLLATQQ
ncbi:hypothetical protein HD599_002510 [Conyzicola lurida]|uniref:GerMN domain-containing protein n=1 Tax=Conyzicola lurida TaxID=1172621 RepID=A0A841ALU8_9MICO|nr:LpqB family beta-propeller domain-containing protein [Conyzicola lurida]MBB5844187.1 hypothetical protein [Conyzicola lurida]